MRRFLIVAGCMVLFGTIVLAASEGTGAPLSVKVTTDKEKYTINESIKLTYTLTNKSNQALTIDTAKFLQYPPACLIIRAPNGQLVGSLKHYPFAPEVPGLKVIWLCPLPPGGFAGIKLDLFHEYPDIFPTGEPHGFDAPGVYEITGIYQNDREAVGDAKWLWTGKVTSATVRIEVVKPTEEQVQELLTLLRKGSTAQQHRALETIRKAQIAELLPEVEGFLDSESEHLRREAAHAMFLMANPKFYDTYVEHLKSLDEMVRGYMAHSLGRLRDERAVAH